MTPENISPPDRISSAFQKLIPVSQKLQNASEELSKPVVDVEEALKRLNLGVASWTLFHKQGDPNDAHIEWSLGYGRHQNRWGILVMQSDRIYEDPHSPTQDTIWFFHDAPRFIKPKAIDALPELIEGLVAVAEKTTQKLLKKVPDATGLAGAVTKHFDEKRK